MTGAARLLFVAIAIAVCAGDAGAQQAAELEGRRLWASRAQLTELLGRAEPGSPLALVVQLRLVDGDLRVGDGVALAVAGEAQLTDTFVVDASGHITLPDVGPISMRGVLYGEVEPHLRVQLARFVREPVVRARAMVRMLVTGAVARPGFYLVPADALISETVMAAGGVTPDAKIQDARALRAGATVFSGPQMRMALTQGWTLDRANLQSGDELAIPGNRGRSATYDRVRTVGVLLSIPLTIYSLTKIF